MSNTLCRDGGSWNITQSQMAWKQLKYAIFLFCNYSDCIFLKPRNCNYLEQHRNGRSRVMYFLFPSPPPPLKQSSTLFPRSLPRKWGTFVDAIEVQAVKPSRISILTDSFTCIRSPSYQCFMEMKTATITPLVRWETCRRQSLNSFTHTGSQCT